MTGGNRSVKKVQKSTKSTKTTTTDESHKNTKEKKPIYKEWWFWAVGAVILVAIIVIIWIICASSNNTDGDSTADGKKWVPACSDGATDMISGGEWIVGKDIASGNYLVESKDGYAYAYIYKSSEASSYDKTVSLDKSKGYLHLENGQKVKVSSGNIDLVCKDFGNLELLSSNKTTSAGNYTLVSTNSYFYAYVYENEDDSSYSATISINSVGGTKDFRFKDGQYIKVSSGNAFLIDKKASNYDELVNEAKKLANALATPKAEEKEESKPDSSSTSSPSAPSGSSNSSSSSNSNSSSSSSSSSPSTSTTNASFRKAMSDYESFMNKYVDFMKKYKNSSDVSSMLSDYSKMMQEYAKYADSIQNYNQSNLSAADWAYYLEVVARVNKKLLEIQ